MKFILSWVFVLIVCSVNFSFALTISTSVDSTLSNRHPEEYWYVYQDEKSANTGSTISYVDQNSSYIGYGPEPLHPFSTDISGQAMALASSSGLLLVSTLTERSLPAMDRSYFSAFSSWQDTFTNNEIHEQKFYLDLDITSIDMFTSKVAPFDATWAVAQYGVSVTLNGKTIWSSSHLMHSYRELDHYYSDFFSLHLPETTHNILLGTYISGESFTLKYSAMGRASLGDAGDLGAGVSPFTVSGKVTSAVKVPEPSTLLLLGSGLLGLVWYGRKR